MTDSSSPPRLTRRQMLAGAGVAAVALLPGGVRLVAGTDAPAGDVAGRLVGLVDDPDALRALGRHHLRQRIDRPTSGELAREILPPTVSDAQARQLDDDRLLDLVAGRVRTEHAAGDVTDVDGWLLTPTEARLAALVARRGA